MLCLASTLPHSFTTCSSLGVADIVYNRGLGLRLAHTFTLSPLPCCCYRCQRTRSAAVSGAGSITSRLLQHEQRGRKMRLRRDIFCSSSAFARANAHASLSAWMLSGCRCQAVAEKARSARWRALDKRQPQLCGSACPMGKQGQICLTWVLKHFTILILNDGFSGS